VSIEERREAVEQVRRHITIAIAMHVDPALTAWAGTEGKPPVRFDAYQEFADGMTAFVRGIAGESEASRNIDGFTAASAHLQRAFQLDSTYYIAALWWFWSRENVGDRFGADSVLRILEPHRTSMSPYERVLYDYNVAVVHGTPEERYQLDEKLVYFAPASEFLFCRARDALESGHPVEAMDVLERLDDTYSWVRLMAPPRGFRVRALVQQREYTRATDLARQIHKESPGEVSSAYPALDALRALNRLDDVERWVAHSPERDDEPEPPANLLLYAGLHLQAAGRNENAQRLFERALAAASSPPPGNRHHQSTRHHSGPPPTCEPSVPSFGSCSPNSQTGYRARVVADGNASPPTRRRWSRRTRSWHHRSNSCPPALFANGHQ
jgi:tetratricopeptide (TPR) repeat protein